MKVPIVDKTRTDLSDLWERLRQIRPRSGFSRSVAEKPDEPVHHIAAPSAQIVESFRVYSKWASIVAILMSYHILIGWIFNISILKSPWPHFFPTSFKTAVSSILAGVALYFVQTKREKFARKRQMVVNICASLIAFICVLALIEYLFGWLGVERRIFPMTQANVLVGTMLPISVISFLMVALALVFHERPRIYRWAEVLALAAATMSLLALASYMYQARTFQLHLPVYAAAIVFLISSGILCARADRGFMAKVTSDSFGGVMARRLLPATLFIPIVLGWLQHQGQRAGLYSTEPGLAFFAVANVVVFTTVVWWGVSSLHRMDIKRREAEYELKDTAAKLARSNADLEQFAYVASHDLKEPLRAISGSIQILQEQYRHELGEEADEVIKHTVDGATRMQRLIEDLLTYSRLTTREAPIEPTDCSQLLQEVLANLETAIKESKAVVTSDPLPTVNADRTQLLQVLQNLIANGIKYRSERTPKIHVSAEDKGDEWLFSVRDNGIGIAPQYADRIFRIFQRLHTRREYGGTGIGLAICKKIVERHGGHIWVDSEPEEGSTFFFTLPK